jgi:general secretion pathway protein E
MKNARQLVVQCMEAAGAHGMALPSVTASSSMVNTLLDSGHLDEDAFLSSLATGLQLPWVAAPAPDSADAPELKRIIPARVALKHRLLPLSLIEEEGRSNKKVAVATCDPFDLIARQAVAQGSRCPGALVRGSAQTSCSRRLRDFYGVGADVFEEILKGREVDADELDQRDEANVIDEDDEEATVVKFVNQIIREALEQHATDIHVEPMEDKLRLRYRIDGRLRELPVPENIKAAPAIRARSSEGHGQARHCRASPPSGWTYQSPDRRPVHRRSRGDDSLR